MLAAGCSLLAAGCWLLAAAAAGALAPRGLTGESSLTLPLLFHPAHIFSLSRFAPPNSPFSQSLFFFERETCRFGAKSLVESGGVRAPPPQLARNCGRRRAPLRLSSPVSSPATAGPQLPLSSPATGGHPLLRAHRGLFVPSNLSLRCVPRSLKCLYVPGPSLSPSPWAGISTSSA